MSFILTPCAQTKDGWPRMRISLIPLLLMSILTLPTMAEQLQPPSHLRCESRETPLGLDTPRPRLSWQLEDSR
jgi:hypothetical protein